MKHNKFNGSIENNDLTLIYKKLSVDISDPLILAQLESALNYVLKVQDPLDLRPSSLDISLFFIINRTTPLRVSLKDEIIGLNVSEHGAKTELIDLLSVMQKQEHLHDLSARVPVEKGLFQQYKVDPTCICFEITETAAISNLRAATIFMDEITALGCSFSLDDFGSGLSSFEYLKNLKVDYLKIDGCFIKDIVDDSIDMAMVQSINSIGHVMGLKTIAEFVENESIVQKLQQIGVDYVQGYHIDKPTKIEKLSLS